MTEAEERDQVDAASAADVDLLLVDEFSPDEIREAVRRTRAHRQHGGKTVIEYSGGATLETVRAIAECGVDRISIGAITKHVRAVDLRSEEHTSELQSLMRTSYPVFCLKKKNTHRISQQQDYRHF